jgi:hypothetical protein
VKPRTRWKLQHYWPLPIPLIAVLITTASGQWLSAVSWLVWIVVLVLNEMTSHSAFHMGWWKGQLYQASVMASDLTTEDKRQLLKAGLEPWDQVIEVTLDDTTR